jgi:hypothetical protein
LRFGGLPDLLPDMERKSRSGKDNIMDEKFALFTGVWLIVFILIMIWSAVWKAMAMWRAARNGHSGWYIVLLLLNTVGILDIIYYFAVGDQTNKKS